MELRAALDLPEAFRAKARYALRVLLAPWGIKIRWTDAQTVADEGGLYYGFSPLPFRSGTAPVLCLCSHPETWAYFNAFKDFDVTSVFDWPGLPLVEGEPIPVLFGQPLIDEPAEVVRWVQADIVASAFFWLSDWQNHIRAERDGHARQPFAGSLQQHLGLHFRAVVDEYGALLYRLLAEAGFAWPRDTPAEWSAAFSHDLDRIRKKSPGIAVRESVDFLMLNKRRETFGKRVRRWGAAMVQLARSEDAYEASILRLLAEERQRGIAGVYLFKSVLERHLNDARDYLSYPFFDRILAEARLNGAELGYHSGYLAGSKPEQLRAEFGRLENRVGAKLQVHRSHYLKFDPAVTFAVLEDLGIGTDSSVAWAEYVGFRAQTCRPYPLFDTARNRELAVLECPLGVMDTQPFGYQRLDGAAAVEQVGTLLHTVRRHNGVMVWNFHHHIHDPLDAPGWNVLLMAAYDRCTSAKVSTFGQLHEIYAPLYAAD